MEKRNIRGFAWWGFTLRGRLALLDHTQRNWAWFWRYQIDDFVHANQEALAALAWGLRQEWGETPDVPGIDLKPTPHFVACSNEAIEELNQNVGNRLQEILGIVEGYDPESEVVMMVIGDGQVKLINFKPKTPPPECFQHGHRGGAQRHAIAQDVWSVQWLKRFRHRAGHLGCRR